MIVKTKTKNKTKIVFGVEKTSYRRFKKNNKKVLGIIHTRFGEEIRKNKIRQILGEKRFINDLIEIIFKYEEYTFELKKVQDTKFDLKNHEGVDFSIFDMEIIPELCIVLFSKTNLCILNLSNNTIETFPQNDNHIQSILYIDETRIAIHDRKYFVDDDDLNNFGDIKILDLKSKQYISVLKDIYTVTKLELLSGTRILAICNEYLPEDDEEGIDIKGVFLIWDFTNGHVEKIYMKNYFDLEIISYSHMYDDNKIILGSRHDGLIICDIFTGNELYRLSKYPIYGGEKISDKVFMAITNEFENGNNINIWDLNISRDPIVKYSSSRIRFGSIITLLPNYQVFIVGYKKSLIWNFKTGTVLKFELKRYPKTIRALPDGRVIMHYYSEQYNEDNKISIYV